MIYWVFWHVCLVFWHDIYMTLSGQFSVNDVAERQKKARKRLLKHSTKESVQCRKKWRMATYSWDEI